MRFDLAETFNRWREVIEAAETPFAKLSIFILPILAPTVPASLTGLHLYKLFTDVFKFSNEWSATLSIIIAIVLEMLGYVGAISFIQAVFRLVKTRNALYILPSVLNGLAYLFYLALMFLVNYKLGEFFQTPQIINTIVGLLSFVTVPTGLLAANYLSQKELKEEDKEEKVSKREERLERYRIKHGKVTGNLPEASVTYEKVTTGVESFQKVSTHWRNVSKQLSRAQKVFIATHTPAEVAGEMAKSGLVISPRTASNWCSYAKQELGM